MPGIRDSIDDDSRRRAEAEVRSQQRVLQLVSDVNEFVSLMNENRIKPQRICISERQVIRPAGWFRDAEYGTVSQDTPYSGWLIRDAIYDMGQFEYHGVTILHDHLLLPGPRIRPINPANIHAEWPNATTSLDLSYALAALETFRLGRVATGYINGAEHPWTFG